MALNHYTHHHHGRTRILAMIVCAVLSVTAKPAIAKTYVYPAVCEKSYSKQGEQADDLTTQKGKPIICDSVVLSLLDNGRVMFQVTEKSSHLTPIGFSGSAFDYEMNPNFATLPLEKIYLPHSTNPGTPEAVEGVEGFCFFDGKLNIRALSNVSCAAKIEIGTQRLVYHLNVRVTGLGQSTPGLP